MNKKISGLSLIEMIFVIAIAGMVALLAARYFAESRFNLKITAAVSEIQQIVGASYEWLNLESQLDFAGSNAANGVPVSMSQLTSTACLSSNYTQDPWGGTVVVNADPSSPSYVQITLPNASLKACNNLKQRLATKAHSQIATCTSGSGYYGSF